MQKVPSARLCRFSALRLNSGACLQQLANLVEVAMAFNILLAGTEQDRSSLRGLRMVVEGRATEESDADLAKKCVFATDIEVLAM